MPKRSKKRRESAPLREAGSILRGRLPLEQETAWFVLVSALDVFMTYLLIWQPGFTEGNPVARFFLYRWGIKGMVYFKFFMVAFVAVIAQIIARKREDIGRKLLLFATVVVGGVVVYSLSLYLRHFGV